MQRTKKDSGPSLFDVLMDKAPCKISEVTVQKSDSSRVSVFSQGEFLFGISAMDAYDLGLRKGINIEGSQVKPICLAIESDQIKNYILILLAKRPYPRNILLKKLLSRGYTKHSAESVLSDFEEKGWINDESYAKGFVQDKYNIAGWGPKKIELFLKRDGVAEGVIQLALKSLEPAACVSKTLEKLVNKRKLHFLRENDTFKRKKKIVDYLLRKGFNPNEIFTHIDTLLQNLEH
jgi:regulatory protein